MSSEVNISDPAIRAELDKLSKLDGGVAFRASPQHAHHTWARTFHSSPELYIQPESLEEVEKAITLARRCRKRITTVGCGHSPSDLTCTSSWMMNLDNFNKILSVNKEAGLVTMQAGIRLYQLGAELDKLGLAMPNLGSINDQSIAGAISTGTHGSTLRHSILSSSITSLRITLASSRTLFCSPDENEELFRAALCSLGALGVITEITFQAVPAFTLHWSQTVYPDTHMLNTWKGELWTQAEFVRVWWFPYTRRSTVWKASKTDDSPEKMPYKPSYYDTKFGYTIYHNLLYLAHYVPRILPWVEWFVFGMQYGFSTGPKTTIEAIQPSREALLMNCLYSQYVNEWALPLHEGPMALRRLSSWLNRLKPTDPDYVEHGIPFSAEGIWVHAPIEVRVSDTTVALKNNDGTPRKSVRPYLDSTSKDGPTLYLNATLYRPYNMDPPCRVRYYQGFEYLMRELGGKPHWAKNFETAGQQIEEMYGDDLQAFCRVRDEADPEGLFAGPWHRRYLLGDQKPCLELEEVESTRKPLPTGGIEVFGELLKHSETTDGADYVSKPIFDEAKKIAAQAKKEAESKALAQAKREEDDRQANLAAHKALEQAERLRLQQIADDKAAFDAAAENARLQRIEDDRRAAALAEEQERVRLQKIADKIAADKLKEEQIIKREADESAARETHKLKLKQEQESQAANDAETLRLQQESDVKAKALLEEQRRIQREIDELAAREANELRLKQEQDAKAKAELKERQRIEREATEMKAADEAARLQRDREEREAARVESERLEKQKEEQWREAASIESARLKKIEEDRIASEFEIKRIADEKAEQDRIAAEELAQQKRNAELEAKRIADEKAESARLQRQHEEKDESDRLAAIEAQRKEDKRLAAIAKKEEDDRLAREAEAARIEQERIANDRRAKEQKRLADEKAEKERVIAERKQKAEAVRLAAIEKRKRDDEHNAKLAAAEAQRLREEAAERYALRQQQLEEAAAARAKEEYEKKMVAEHDRREAAKAEAALREKEDKDRIARVAHDNEMRLQKGRLAREAKEREDRLERDRLAEDARQIEKRRAVEEKRRQIQEKKELQRITIQKKQAERKEIAAQKKAIEDSAAKHAQEQRAQQDKEEAEARAKKAEAVRKAFQAQVAARAAKAAESAPKEHTNDTSAKARRSPSPKPNGTQVTPAAKTDESKAQRVESQSGGQSENSKQQSPSSPAMQRRLSDDDNKDKSPRSAQRIFRPTLGTPTPSVLLAKREGLEPSAFAPAQKRMKLEEQAEEPAVPVKKVVEKVWKPQYRPNSLDELLAEQERERAQEGGN